MLILIKYVMKIYLIRIINLLIVFFWQSCNKSYCLVRNHNCKWLTQSQLQPILDDLLDNLDLNISSKFNISEINEIFNSKVQIRKNIPKMCRSTCRSFDYLIQKYFPKSNWNELSLINAISMICFTSPNSVR